MYQTVFVAANVTNRPRRVIVNMFGQAGVDYNVRIGTGASRSAPNGNDWSIRTGRHPQLGNGAKLANAERTAGDHHLRSGGIGREDFDGQRLQRVVQPRCGGPGRRRDHLQQGADHARSGVPWRNTWPANGGCRSLRRRRPRSPPVRREPTAPTVSWAAPLSTVVPPISGYTVTSVPGDKTCTTAGALSCTVTGLTNHTTYTFTVTATNAVGVGAASSPSNSLTTPP